MTALEDVIRDLWRLTPHIRMKKLEQLLREMSAEIDDANVRFSGLLAERDAVCTWADDPDGYWATDCGEAFEIHVGSPAENGLRFCCFCGRRLAEGAA